MHTQKVKEHIEYLQNNYKADETLFINIWCPEDVIFQFKEEQTRGNYNSDFEITEEDAINILGAIAHNNNTDVGMNWDTINVYIQQHINTKYEVQDGE